MSFKKILLSTIIEATCKFIAGIFFMCPRSRRFSVNLGGAVVTVGVCFFRYALSMGLTKQYLRVGQSAKNRLFGVPPVRRGPSLKGDRTPLQMLISEKGTVNQGRIAVVVLGIFALTLGILMTTVPWVDWIILKQLRLWNGTLTYYYWKQPGVMRLTKVWVFNVTNEEAFLNEGHKPKLEEVGPFVYREEMQKVNVKFHENGSVSFQHRKILQFMPELSGAQRDVKLVVPNIPLLTLTSKSAELPNLMRIGLSMILRTLYTMSEFNKITADELLFGYEESLTKLAHKFYPQGKRPPSKMGLLIGRNATMLSDIQTIYSGYPSMKDFGLMEKLNGLDHLPYWSEPPCNSIRASEGSLFPPRVRTNEDVVHLFDKDLCRIWPFRYRFDTKKSGITVGKYTPDENIFTSGDKFKDNKCFCPGREVCPPDGLQNISPCQFDAPVYLSFPHFYGMDNPEITDAVEGLKPVESEHQSILLLQQSLGVPLEARIRVQLNLKVTHSNLGPARRFPSMYFPVIWLEEGVEEMPNNIFNWIYLATELSSWLVPLAAYCTMAFGAFVLLMVFLRTYRSAAFAREAVERGRRTLRRGSSFFINGQHRLLIIRDSYTLLQNQPVTAETSFHPDPDG